MIRSQRISCRTAQEAVELHPVPHPRSARATATCGANATFDAGLSEGCRTPEAAVFRSLSGGQELTAARIGRAGITTSAVMSHRGTPRVSAGVPAANRRPITRTRAGSRQGVYAVKIRIVRSPDKGREASCYCVAILRGFVRISELRPIADRMHVLRRGLPLE